MNDLTWVEISRDALKNNINELRKVIGPNTILCPCVKANAYGHGLIESSKIFLESDADWLGVNSLYEARALRDSGIKCPIYVLGYVSLDQLEEAINLELRIVVYNIETIKKLSKIAKKNKVIPKIHIKIETGNNRQGVLIPDLLKFANLALSNNLEIEGLTTHFANIEDTTDHSYAMQQISKFSYAISILEKAGINIPIMHCANSAATMLFKGVKLNMVRPGIACYGMWPSNETFVSVIKETKKEINLMPAFTWKSKIAQIKEIDTGEYIGYGCSYKTSHKTKLAIIPVGYYDGYDRCVNGAFVLINGFRAPIRGRVCMNIIMAEISDIPSAKLEDEVILIGRQGKNEVTAEELAEKIGTINYEVVSRINPLIPRKVV